MSTYRKPDAQGMRDEEKQGRWLDKDRAQSFEKGFSNSTGMAKAWQSVKDTLGIGGTPAAGAESDPYKKKSR